MSQNQAGYLYLLSISFSCCSLDIILHLGKGLLWYVQGFWRKSALITTLVAQEGTIKDNQLHVSSVHKAASATSKWYQSAKVEGGCPGVFNTASEKGMCCLLAMSFSVKWRKPVSASDLAPQHLRKAHLGRPQGGTEKQRSMQEEGTEILWGPICVCPGEGGCAI